MIMMLMIMTINHLNNDRGGGGAGDNCLSSLGWLLHHLFVRMMMMRMMMIMRMRMMT